jgi:hypothetical protein
MILNFIFIMCILDRVGRLSGPSEERGAKPPRKTRKAPMIVCHCKALSDRVIRQAVRDGARTHRDGAAAAAAPRCSA